MFDFFTPSKAPAPAAPVFVPPDDVGAGNVRELMKHEAFVDEDGDGVDDNFEAWVEDTRSGTVSRSKYAKWQVAEHNRQAAAALGEEMEKHLAMKGEMDTKFIAKSQANVREARTQRERALEKVRKAKEERLGKGINTKAQIDAAKEEMERQHLAYMQAGVDKAQELGKHLKARVKAVRSETKAEANQAARQLKQEGREKLAARLAEEEAELEEKRRRAAQIKAETRPEVSQASKFFFYSCACLLTRSKPSHACRTMPLG